MRPWRAIATVVLVALAASMLASCSKNKEKIVVAEFKDRKITLARFEGSYARVKPQFLPKASGFEGLKEFLTTMLNKEVLSYKADELGYDKDPTVKQGMDTYERIGLQAGYLKLMVSDRVKVTDELVREHYRNKGASVSIKQILLDTPYQADEVYGMLQDGADFESVCKQYSKAPDAEMGGRILTMKYQAYTTNIEDAVFSLKLGEFSKPVETAYGYFIYKLLRRSDARVKDPIENIRETLEQEVFVRQELLLTNQVTDEIRSKYNLEWYWENLLILLDGLPPDRSLTNPPSRNDEVYPLLFFEDEDLDKPVATYTGKTITVKTFSDWYDRASFFTRPRREMRVGGIKGFITERIMAEIVLKEIDNSDVRENKEIATAIRGKQEELMINKLWDDLINSQTVVSEEMIRNYYNENRQFFKSPEKRRFGVILTGDEETAMAAVRDIKSGQRFRNVVQAYSIDEETKERLGQSDLISRGEQQELEEVGFSLPAIGSVSPPFETSRGWMVLKLVEKVDASEYSLMEARGSIVSALKQMENERRLNELLDKWKKELGVTIYEDKLRKAEVVERSADATPPTVR